MRQERIIYLWLFLVVALGTVLVVFLRSQADENTSKPTESFLSVLHIVDGDTIDVLIDGKKERVRLIGIDTPETVDQRKRVQCYGPEASAKMKELLSGKFITLQRKPNEDRDDYDRLLRYVSLDGRDIGAQMIEEGYARSTCAAFRHPRCAEYDRLERSAKISWKGRWGRCR